MPLETTVVDLWRLVHDYEIPTIVMLNKDIQKGVCCYIFACCLRQIRIIDDIAFFALSSKQYINVIINLCTCTAFSSCQMTISLCIFLEMASKK